MSRPRPLRVTFVVPDLGIGGAERHVTTLAARLDPSLVVARVICLGRRGELFTDLEAAGVPGLALGRSRRQALPALRELVGELRRTRPDVVVVRGYSAELLGRTAAALARVPRTVVWVHNCDDIEPRGALRRVSDRLLEPVTDAYFGVAHRQVDYLTRDLGHPARKVTIIHNGVDPAPFDDVSGAPVRSELGLADDAPVVGILAALRPEKDHETFLEAAVLVAAEVPTSRFLVVGEGERRGELEDLAHRLGISDRVVFTGARDDVPAVLRSIDVFTLTSFTIECFPMALLEAMASWLPAVCTDVGGVGEIIDEGVTGHLVPQRDPEALARRLVPLLRSGAERRRLGDAARERVERHFTLERSVRQAEQELLAVAAPAPVRHEGPVRLAVVLDETSVGGVEIMLLHTFRAFDPRRVRPVLVCLRSAGPLAADFRAAGFEVEVLGRSGRFDPTTLPRLRRSLRRNGIEAVLVTHHHRGALALGRVAARLAGVRVTLVAAHDMDLVGLGSRCLPRWTVATLRWASALVLLAPSQSDYLHREEGVGRRPWSRAREIVIPNGIPLGPSPGPQERDLARRELQLPPDAFVVGIVARLTAQKAHHVLVRAFATLAGSRPQARLVVVGGGPREAELHALVQQLGIADRVRFTGVRRDVAALLPAFDVACLSSVHEAAPVAVIEAMAAGLPVVSTDCGALRDMVTDGVEGYLVPVGDSRRLAERLGTLADDPDLRARLGTAARHRARTSCGIELTAAGYEALLAELVTSAP